jgi:hypothetical protein
MTSSVQRIALAHPVVEESDRGALALADAYWAEIRRRTAGLVRVRASALGPELRLARTVTLFRFGPARTAVAPHSVECRFPIVGGLLAKEEGGWLTFVQHTEPSPALEVSIEDYRPRLSSDRRRLSLRRLVYREVQERLHAAIGQRYLERMAGRAR